MVRLALSAPPRSLFGARAAVTRATLPRCAVADDDDDDGDELVGGETLNLRGRSVSELFLDEVLAVDAPPHSSPSIRTIKILARPLLK